MNTGKHFSCWQQIIIALLLYFACSSLGILLSPHGLAKLVGTTGKDFHYWDLGHYISLSLNPRCWAFYPLWPQLIKLFNADDPLGALRWALILSNTLFAVSLPILLFVLNRLIQSSALSFVILLLYVLNPNSIFHGNGYTESLFSLLGSMAIVALLLPKSLIWNSVLAISIVSISLSRPSLIQLFFAAAVAMVCTWLGSCLTHRENRNSGSAANLNSWRVYLLPTSLILIAATIGYAIYGWYCLKTTGNFFTPFLAQAEWGKSLSFRPSFLLFPKSLLNDLQGLYFPFLLFFIALVLIYFHTKGQAILLYLPKNPLLWLTLFYPPLAIFLYGFRYVQLWKKKALSDFSIPPQIANLKNNYIFFFCLGICMANSIIIFFTGNSYLYSLARFIFATPFFFIAFGVLVDGFKDSQKIRDFLYGCLVISSLGLIHQWYNWGSDRWVG